jgi:hypothetical protein
MIETFLTKLQNQISLKICIKFKRKNSHFEEFYIFIIIRDYIRYRDYNFSYSIIYLKNKYFLVIVINKNNMIEIEKK